MHCIGQTKTGLGPVRYMTTLIHGVDHFDTAVQNYFGTCHICRKSCTEVISTEMVVYQTGSNPKNILTGKGKSEESKRWVEEPERDA